MERLRGATRLALGGPTRARTGRADREQTGTNLVVSRDGVIGYLAPKSENTVTSVQGPLVPYADK